MKTHAFALTLLFVLMTLSACSSKTGKATDAVDAKGACSSATIKAYNHINDRERKFLNLDDIKELHKDCLAYKKLVGEQSCKAIDTETKKTVTATQRLEICEFTQSYLTENEVIPKPTEKSKKSASQRSSKKSSKTRKIVEDTEAFEEEPVMLAPLTEEF